MKLLTLVVVLASIVALSAYDIVRAATVRCVRADDEKRVVSVGEMDALPGRIGFGLERVSHVVRARATLILRGTAGDSAHAVAAVIAVVDAERLFTAAYGAHGNRFQVALNLAPGPHDVRFEVVARDLTGYYKPEAHVDIVAR